MCICQGCSLGQDSSHLLAQAMQEGIHILLKRQVTEAYIENCIDRNKALLRLPTTSQYRPVSEQSIFSVKETFSGFRLHLADLAVMDILSKNEKIIGICNQSCHFYLVFVSI